MNDTAEPTGTPGPSLWRRFLAWLRRVLAAVRAAFHPPVRDEAPPATLGTVTSRQALPQPMVVPARGFVFSFQVHLRLTWEGDEMTEEVLDAWSQHFTPQARRQQHSRVAELARQFPPHQAAQLESCLNRQLGQRVSVFQRSGVTLRARPAFHVRLDDEVKQQLRAAALDRVRLEGEHEVALRRVQLADQLTQRWAAVIGRLHADRYAAGAASLDNPALSGILRQLADSDQEVVDRLATAFREAIHDSRRVGEPLEEHEAREFIELVNAALREGGDADAAPANGHRR